MLKSLKLPRKLIVKVLLLLVVTVIIVSTSNHALARPSVKQYKLKIQRAIHLKFNNWTSNFLTKDYGLESNHEFLNKLEEIKAEKLADDPGNEMWDINEKVLNNLPLEVKVPKYFLKPEEMKPVIQPFDPRFTLGVYLQWIKRHPKEPLPFHWSDWVDLTKLHKYILADDTNKISCKDLFDISGNIELVQNSKLVEVQNYCKDNKDIPLGYQIVDFSGPQTVPNHEILGKSYLYSGAPSPVKLIFMTESQGSYEMDVLDHEANNLKHSLLHNSIVETLVNKHDIKSVNVLDAYQDLVSKIPPENSEQVLSDYEIHIPKESFNIDPQEVIKTMSEKEDLNKLESAYLDSIKYSTNENNPPKFFKEAKLLEKQPQKWLGEHYDWRFFNGINVGKEEQLLSLHRLVKNYLSFARQHGIVTWIAHGSLLSWYWNGIAFPWDTDIDVQMPIGELYNLGRRFNQTLVIENVGNDKKKFNGMGKYFIDVGSSITHRTKGNGNNNIDARFIDVDTGLYIDITGLAITESPAPPRYDYIIDKDKSKQLVLEQAKKNGQIDHYVKNEQLQAYNCRNNHFNTFEELSPLVLSIVENQLSYIPSNFIMTLDYEYGVKGLTKINFKDYYYMNNLRMWVKTSKVLEYMKDPAAWLKKNKSSPLSSEPAPDSTKDSAELASDKKPSKREVSDLEKFQINKLTLDNHIDLLQNNEIFKEFVKTVEFTKAHELEMKCLMKDDYKNAKALIEDYSSQYNVGTALRSDLFMNRLFKDGWNYDGEVEKLLRLTEAYKSV
mmetsp:Transcript_5788/g.6983  ORF Transcript_5788/g.6983 Transcript_5788/m.6983 type:complete len:779 (-) Transcript_5788:965-3301(-)